MVPLCGCRIAWSTLLAPHVARLFTPLRPDMRTPDRRSFDSPRRGGRGKDRFDDFGGGRGAREGPYVPRASYVPAGGRDRGPSSYGAAPRGFGAPGGPETGATVKWFNAEKGFG